MEVTSHEYEKKESQKIQEQLGENDIQQLQQQEKPISSEPSPSEPNQEVSMDMKDSDSSHNKMELSSDKEYSIQLQANNTKHKAKENDPANIIEPVKELPSATISQPDSSKEALKNPKQDQQESENVAVLFSIKNIRDTVNHQDGLLKISSSLPTLAQKNSSEITNAAPPSVDDNRQIEGKTAISDEAKMNTDGEKNDQKQDITVVNNGEALSEKNIRGSLDTTTLTSPPELMSQPTALSQTPTTTKPSTTSTTMPSTTFATTTSRLRNLFSSFGTATAQPPSSTTTTNTTATGVPKEALTSSVSSDIHKLVSNTSLQPTISIDSGLHFKDDTKINTSLKQELIETQKKLEECMIQLKEKDTLLKAKTVKNVEAQTENTISDKSSTSTERDTSQALSVALSQSRDYFKQRQTQHEQTLNALQQQLKELKEQKKSDLEVIGEEQLIKMETSHAKDLQIINEKHEEQMNKLEECLRSQMEHEKAEALILMQQLKERISELERSSNNSMTSSSSPRGSSTAIQAKGQESELITAAQTTSTPVGTTAAATTKGGTKMKTFGFGNIMEAFEKKDKPKTTDSTPSTAVVTQSVAAPLANVASNITATLPTAETKKQSDDFNKQVKQFQARISQLEKDLESKETELKMWSQIKQDLEEQYNQQINQLGTKIKQLNYQLEEKKKQLDSTATKSSQLNTTILDLQKRLEEEKTKTELAKEELTATRSGTSTQNQYILELQEKNKQITAKYEERKNQLKASERKVEDLEKEKENFLKQGMELKVTLEQTHLELNQLQENKVEMETELEKLKHIQEESLDEKKRLQITLEDKEKESKINERKQQTLIKDLQKQLAMEKKRHIKKEETSPGGDNPDSFASGNLEPIGNLQRKNSYPSSYNISGSDPDLLLQKVSEMQQKKLIMEDEMRKLRLEVQMLQKDLENKSVLLRSYIMRESGLEVSNSASSGKPSTPTTPIKKWIPNLLIRNNIQPMDPTMLMEINLKMQQVLEELTGENIKLKEQLEILSRCEEK